MSLNTRRPKLIDLSSFLPPAKIAYLFSNTSPTSFPQVYVDPRQLSELGLDRPVFDLWIGSMLDARTDFKDDNEWLANMKQHIDSELAKQDVPFRRDRILQALEGGLKQRIFDETLSTTPRPTLED